MGNIFVCSAKMANHWLTAISSLAVEAVFFFFHRGDESFDHFAKTQTVQFGLMVKTLLAKPGSLVGMLNTTDVGTGGMSTKVESALIATAAGIPTVVTAASEAAAALAGEPTGTSIMDSKAWTMTAGRAWWRPSSGP